MKTIGSGLGLSENVTKFDITGTVNLLIGFVLRFYHPSGFNLVFMHGGYKLSVCVCNSFQTCQLGENRDKL